MDGRRDAVELALAALRIPRTNVRDGRRYNNARILRLSLRRVGEEAFREAVWRQLRENETDGLPRSAAATSFSIWLSRSSRDARSSRKHSRRYANFASAKKLF